uniref:Uncharacterized protein n=1 Tax=Arundo donax TaxID=35708 RepID=A0A0A9CRC6_ARUDO
MPRLHILLLSGPMSSARLYAPSASV